MYRLLNARINTNHCLVDIRMIPHEDFGVPRGRHEDSVDAARQGRREDVCDLQADDEGKGDDYGGEAAVGVVLRLREEEV